MAKHVWVCTICGKESFWNKYFSCYGSEAHYEVCPYSLPVSCSTKCKAEITSKINSGAFQIPVLRLTRAGGEVIKNKVGY